MDRWADHVVTAKRRGQDPNRIEWLQVHAGTPYAVARTVGRGALIESIERGETAVTAYKRGGIWQMGARIEVVKVDGEKFLRTDGNQTKADNLGDLPDF